MNPLVFVILGVVISRVVRNNRYRRIRDEESRKHNNRY